MAKKSMKKEGLVDTLSINPADKIRLIETAGHQNRLTKHQKVINIFSFIIIVGWFLIIILYMLSGIVGLCDVQSNTPIAIIDKVGTVLVSLIIGIYLTDYLRSK